MYFKNEKINPIIYLDEETCLKEAIKYSAISGSEVIIFEKVSSVKDGLIKQKD